MANTLLVSGIARSKDGSPRHSDDAISCDLAEKNSRTEISAVGNATTGNRGPLTVPI